MLEKEGQLVPYNYAGAYSMLNAAVMAIEACTGIPLDCDVVRPEKRLQHILAQIDPRAEQIFGTQEPVQKMLLEYIHYVYNVPFSPLGRSLVFGELEAYLKARQATMNYVCTNPTVANTELQPLVITGLPRTGSTLLQRLLVCDPLGRGLRMFEIAGGSESILSTPEEARRLCESKFKLADKLCPEYFPTLSQSHYVDASEYEEEVLVLSHQVYMSGLLDPSITKRQRDPAFADAIYIYLRRFLQLRMSQTPPCSHIVLKTPFHSSYLPNLFSAFPNARVVVMHRDPLEIVPSWSLLQARIYAFKARPDAIDLTEFGKMHTEELLDMAGRLTSFHRVLREKGSVEIHPAKAYGTQDTVIVSDRNLFHLNYEDLVSDPIGSVRKLYEYFGMEYTVEFDEAMKLYLENNKKGKHERQKVDAVGMFSMSAKEIRTQFQEYIDEFQVTTKEERGAR